jgi:PAS domain S-box-containing protein
MPADEERLSEQVVAALATPVLACDQSGTVVLANSAVRALLGAPGGLVGMLFAALVPERLRSRDGVPIVELLAARAREREPGPIRLALVRRGGVEIEVDCVAAGGDSAPLVLSFAGIHDEPGASPRSGSYQLIFEHAPLGILHFDERAIITACNQNFVNIIGSSRAVLIGLNMLSLPDPDMVACVRRALTGALASYDGRYRSATADKITPVSVLFAPVVEHGRVTGGVGIIRDMTEAQALRARLAQADRLASLGTLAAGVAHEINNPLTYVMSSIETAVRAIDRGDTTPRLRRHLETALDGAERIRRIVRDLRIFSRAEDTPRAPIDVHSVLDAAVNLCGSVVNHRARLVKRYGDVAPVWADEVRLGQVFVNLLINAAHAIPERGSTDHWISIVTAPIGNDRISIEIADNGVGIPADILPHVFEPFVTTKPVGVGTGLGLSICHSIVTALRGAITIDSEVGHGTTVRVVLPRATGVAAEIVAAPAPPTTRLLIVDDEPRLVEALAAILSELHYEVAVTSNGADALAMLARDDDFDAVLCDVMMPGRSGLDVFEEVRLVRPALARRFVFMSGGVVSAEVARALADTGQPRIAKPFTIEQLGALLEASGLSGAAKPARGEPRPRGRGRRAPRTPRRATPSRLAPAARQDLRPTRRRARPAPRPRPRAPTRPR